jgi:hypothetical protein
MGGPSVFASVLNGKKLRKKEQMAGAQNVESIYMNLNDHVILPNDKFFLCEQLSQCNRKMPFDFSWTKILRGEEVLTASGLAKRCGIPQSTIASWLKGTDHLKFPQLPCFTNMGAVNGYQ